MHLTGDSLKDEMYLCHTHTHTHIHIYIYIYSHPHQIVSLYYISSVWLDTLDVSCWDRNKQNLRKTDILPFIHFGNLRQLRNLTHFVLAFVRLHVALLDTGVLNSLEKLWFTRIALVRVRERERERERGRGGRERVWVSEWASLHMLAQTSEYVSIYTLFVILWRCHCYYISWYIFLIHRRFNLFFFYLSFPFSIDKLDWNKVIFNRVGKERLLKNE